MRRLEGNKEESEKMWKTDGGIIWSGCDNSICWMNLRRLQTSNFKTVLATGSEAVQMTVGEMSYGEISE